MSTIFIIIYLLKLINYLFLYVSLYLTDRLFSEQYMKKVYGEETNPPNILQFPFLSLSIQSGFSFFLFIILILLMTIFKKENNTFAINWYVIKTYLFDFILTLIMISVVSIIVGMIIQKKKYFRYKTEGLRAIRAYKEILKYLSIVLYLLPYYWYF